VSQGSIELIQKVDTALRATDKVADEVKRANEQLLDLRQNFSLLFELLQLKEGG
jgi:hypothetical protein